MTAARSGSLARPMETTQWRKNSPLQCGKCGGIVVFLLAQFGEAS
jgi:hypothetical protein